MPCLKEEQVFLRACKQWGNTWDKVRKLKRVYPFSSCISTNWKKKKSQSLLHRLCSPALSQEATDLLKKCPLYRTTWRKHLAQSFWDDCEVHAKHQQPDKCFSTGRPQEYLVLLQTGWSITYMQWSLMVRAWASHMSVMVPATGPPGDQPLSGSDITYRLSEKCPPLGRELLWVELCSRTPLSSRQALGQKGQKEKGSWPHFKKRRQLGSSLCSRDCIFHSWWMALGS